MLPLSAKFRGGRQEGDAREISKYCEAITREKLVGKESAREAICLDEQKEDHLLRAMSQIELRDSVIHQKPLSIGWTQSVYITVIENF